MKEKNTPQLNRPEIMFLSFFGTGFLPKAPGTWGSLATIPFLYFLGRFNAPFFVYIPFLLIVTFISCYIAEMVQNQMKLHDPGWIVIDEVLGMLTTWLFIQEHNIYHLALIFVLFRGFDIFKIWPATYFDKKVTHGAGTILDDIISGIFAGVTYTGLVLLFQNFSS
jgi:phosphatidylglycerophosphatase A